MPTEATLITPDDRRPPSRYASREEALSERFMAFNREFDRISQQFQLPDHTVPNRQRYPWATCLHFPEFYASRLWEYPWAVTESEVSSGMCCADIGCGQSAFPIYLKEVIGCDVVGFDPDDGASSDRYYAHGVPEVYRQHTGIRYVCCGLEHLLWPDNSFDRVFCLSVIEHIPHRWDRAVGMREIARVLKPGGLALVSVDVNLKKRVINPLELIWESGLELYGMIDLTMPRCRFGIFCDGQQPADVFGFVLRKQESEIQVEAYEHSARVEAWRAAQLRNLLPPEWEENSNLAPGLESVYKDLKRNSLKDGRPSLFTVARIFLKTLLRRYPPPRESRS